jgi:hypothetical protein
MITLLKDLFRPAFKLEPRRRQEITWAIGITATACMLGAIALAILASVHTPNADNMSPAWDAINACRAALIRIFITVPTIIIAIGIWFGVFQTTTHSEIGRRWMIWDAADSEPVKAAKTRNAGIILGALAVAVILGMLIAVPR